MIKAIDLIRLRNPEFISFCDNFTSIVNTSNPTTLMVKPQYDAMMLKLEQLKGLFKTATANPITTEIEALDLRRDRAIIGLAGTIKHHVYHYDPVISEAAGLLSANLDLYGGSIAAENYVSETTMVNNILNDWSTKPELQNAVNVLGILLWTNELKAANEQFNLKFLERNHDYGQTTSDNVKSKRAEVMTTYYDLRKRLDAFAEIEGTELYRTTIADLNALIETYNAVLTGRKPAKKQPSTTATS